MARHRRHGHGDGLTRAERRERAELLARYEGLRDERDATMHDQMVIWRQEMVQRTTPTEEQPINPLGKAARISSEVGDRDTGIADASTHHIAFDMVPTDGTHQAEVSASLSGRVLYAGPWSYNLGNAVIIGGDDGNIYIYGHLANDSLQAATGQRVNQGQHIADMGNTGNLPGHLGYHLHFVIREPRATLQDWYRAQSDQQPSMPGVMTVGQTFSRPPINEQVRSALDGLSLEDINAKLTDPELEHEEGYRRIRFQVNGHEVNRGSIIPADARFQIPPYSANNYFDRDGREAEEADDPTPPASWSVSEDPDELRNQIDTQWLGNDPAPPDHTPSAPPSDVPQRRN